MVSKGGRKCVQRYRRFVFYMELGNRERFIMDQETKHRFMRFF